MALFEIYKRLYECASINHACPSLSPSGSDQTEKLHLVAHAFEMSRANGRPFESGRAADNVACRLGHQHRTRASGVGDTACHVHWTAKPITSARYGGS